VNVSDLSPTAEGSLEKKPFVHLLVYVADRMLTGSMRFVAPSTTAASLEHCIFFRDGACSKVRTGEPVIYLGRALVELGLITQATLDATLRARNQSGGLHGEILVESGAIDRAGLALGLRAQMLRKLTYLFAMPPSTTFAFFQDVNLLESWGGPEAVPLDPLPLIWSAVANNPLDPMINATLGRLGSMPLKIHIDSDVTRFGFSPEEMAVVERIRTNPAPLDRLLAGGVAPEWTIKLIVYALLITRHLDHGAHAPPIGLRHIPESTRTRAPTPGTGVAVARLKLKSKLVETLSGKPSSSRVPIVPKNDPPPKAEARLTPELAARRQTILERAAAIDREDYYTMLALPREAGDQAIQAGYFALAKVWHTDRLPAELADIRDAASKVFARMNEAFETLSDPSRRRRYVEMMKGGTGTPEEADTIQKIVDAATDFQRAEICWRTRDLEGARKYIDRALAADPGQSDYIALYVTIEAAQRTTGPIDDLVAMCDLAIDKNDSCERAYFTRGTLRRRMGHAEGAMADFRRAADLNPRNVDAVREVRLHEMRRSKRPGPTSKTPTPDKKDGGVLSGLGKLFKR
jgi:tetratricopeptide (TPR) repeat protein